MAQLRIILGNKNYSSWSLRAWLALTHTGAEFEEEVIPLYREDTRAKLRAQSPSLKVPCLHDGELKISDSLAICEYLAEKFPAAKLWPADVTARAKARVAAARMHSGFFAIRNHMPMNVRADLPGRGRAPGVDDDVERMLELLTVAVSESDGDFLFGGFSIADAFFAPVVSRFRTYGVDVPGAAGRWAERVWQLPSMQTWITASRDEAWTLDKFEL